MPWSFMFPSIRNTSFLCYGLGQDYCTETSSRVDTKKKIIPEVHIYDKTGDDEPRIWILSPGEVRWCRATGPPPSSPENSFKWLCALLIRWILPSRQAHETMVVPASLERQGSPWGNGLFASVVYAHNLHCLMVYSIAEWSEKAIPAKSKWSFKQNFQQK